MSSVAPMMSLEARGLVTSKLQQKVFVTNWWHGVSNEKTQLSCIMGDAGSLEDLLNDLINISDCRIDLD